MRPLNPDGLGRVELVQPEASVALKLQTEFGKERDRTVEVVDNEEDVVHS